MKKTKSLIMLTLSLAIGSFGSFADTPNLNILNPQETPHQENHDATIDAELACSAYGTHRMGNTFNWVAVYYYGSPVMTYAGEYQCGCGDYFVCEGRPHLGHPIGKYYDGSRLYNRRTLNGITVYDATSYYPAYTSNSTIPGFSFSQAF